MPTLAVPDIMNFYQWETGAVCYPRYYAVTYLWYQSGRCGIGKWLGKGSKTVPAMLTNYGYVDDAMQMLIKTDAPSWGYWVETMKQSTLGKTWVMSPEFRDASLNHVFMGDVSAWMTNCLARINYDRSVAGFRHIIIRPHFVKSLDWVKEECRSVNGTIRSAWQRNGDKITLTVFRPIPLPLSIQTAPTK